MDQGKEEEKLQGDTDDPITLAFFHNPGEEEPIQAKIRALGGRLKIAVFGFERSRFIQIINPAPVGDDQQDNGQKEEESVDYHYHGWKITLEFLELTVHYGRRLVTNESSILHRADAALDVHNRPFRLRERDLDIPSIPVVLENPPGVSSSSVSSNEEEEPIDPAPFLHLSPTGEGREKLFDKIIEATFGNANRKFDDMIQVTSSHFHILLKLYKHPKYLQTPGLLHEAVLHTTPRLVGDLFALGVPFEKEHLLDTAHYAISHKYLAPLLSSCLDADPTLSTHLIPRSIDDINLTRKLLDLGAKMDSVEFVDAFCQLLYSYERHMDMIMFILERGFNLNSLTKWNNCPLGTALMYDRTELCQLFLKFGADPNFADGFACAIRTGKLEIVEKMVAAGADVRNPEAIIEASHATNLEIFKYLIMKGASLNVRGKHGITPSSRLTVEMKNYAILNFEVYEVFKVLRAGYDDAHSSLRNTSVDLLVLFIKSLLFLRIPFFHLPSSTAARLGWVRWIEDFSMRIKFTDFINSLSFDGEAFNIDDKFRFKCEITTESYYSCLRVSEIGAEWGSLKVGWRSESYSCKGGGHSEGSIVENVAAFTSQFGRFIELYGSLWGFIALLRCLAVKDDQLVRPNDFRNNWVFSAHSHKEKMSTKMNDPIWYQEAIVQWEADVHGENPSKALETFRGRNKPKPQPPRQPVKQKTKTKPTTEETGSDGFDFFS